MIGLKSQKKQSVDIMATLLILLNLLTLVQQVSAKRSEKQEFSLSRFSWDIATDNPALYDVIPKLNLESIVEELSQMESKMKHDSLLQTRRKRSLYTPNYGKRVHERVAAIETQNTPFSACVRISNDCSGSLISDRHVLTAAHCVHDGKRSKYKLPFLKIGFLRRNGKFHWIRVTKMFVSDAWKKTKGKGTAALDADFAVLRLKRPHGRSYFIPKQSNHHLRSPMMFNGFPGDKGVSAMWHSSCRVKKISRPIILSSCSASEGSSGSGVYESRGRGGYGVTAIVSAALKVRTRKHRFSFTVSTELTAAKVKLICRWMDAKYC